MNSKVKYVEFVCEHCGSPFEKTERYVRMQNKKEYPIRFCSRKCKDADWGKNRLEVTCEICGKKILRQKKDIGIHNYCSDECYSIYRNSLKTILICKACQKEFIEDKAYIVSQEARGQNINFCSKECQTEFMSRDKVEVNCTQCGKTFLKNKSKIGSKTFCSYKCKKQYLLENNSSELTCVCCGKMFITNKYDADKGRKYCSMECRRLHTSKKKELYRDIAHYLRTHSLYDKWRLKVMENANFKCQQCGNGSNLQAHHKKRLYDIAEQYEFNIEKILESEEFNDDQNGVCLCEKCHTKEHPHMKIQQIKNCRPKLKLLKA